MTNEGKRDTEAWVEKHGATYAYAYDKGGKVQRFFGVSGIPHAILVDPTGRIVWRGHPARLKNAMIEKHLGPPVDFPLWDWPSSADKVKKALAKRDFAAARELAVEVPEVGDKVEQTVSGMVQARVGAVQARYDEGDFMNALAIGEFAVADLAGTPEGDAMKELLASIKKDSEAKKVIKAQEDIEELARETYKKKKEVDKAVKKLQKLAEKNAGTFAEKRAREVIDELAALRESLK